MKFSYKDTLKSREKVKVKGMTRKYKRRKKGKRKIRKEERCFISLYYREEYANFLGFTISEKC